METSHADVYAAPPPTERNSAAGTVADSTRKVAVLDKNSPRAQELTDANARMMISDCQPFSMVGDVGFKNLLRVAEPRYRIPNRSVFSEEIIPQLYQTEKGKLKEILDKDSKNVSTIFTMFVISVTMFYGITKILSIAI